MSEPSTAQPDDERPVTATPDERDDERGDEREDERETPDLLPRQ